ncbi:MAG: hypothetical protein ILO34_01530, partial [Kiritimatiellae bacterium]|nr:hypothetical protein [Kiritimatiellia bacterium]
MGKRLYAACAAAVVAVCAVASAGPRVTVIGDSYSTYSGTMPDGYVTCYDGSYNGVTSAAQTYWMRIINALGGTLEVNNSWSGSWVCNANNTLTTPSFISPERLAVLGDPDLFIICGGSNDCWWGKDYGLKGDDPLGQFVYSGWTADELMQFRPAFAYLLDYLKTNFPGAGILVVVNSTDDAQSAYALTEEYASSMETIAAHYSAMCVRCSGVEKVDYHPTSGGFLTMANQALAVLEAARPGGWEGFGDSLVESSTYLRNPAGGVYVANAAGAGTITAADDLLLTRMVLVGGGGAGGGTIGGGGGGGEVVDIAFDTPVAIEYGSEIDFTVGAGGQAGATTTDPGGNGGATTLVIGQTGYTALGGGGGGGWSSG